jgi:Fe-Mn family superoxide dismutase
MQYTPKQFDLPALAGLSQEQIKVHLGLYEGYVKHMNVIKDKIAALRAADAEGNAYIIAELRRRLGFEFDGMRMHEYYFSQLEKGAKAATKDSPLARAATAKYGNGIESLIAHIKEVAGTRGIGWAVTYYDPSDKELYTAFVNDHEVGQLAGLPILLALDLWEHAYMVDYVPAEKKGYVEAFFDNLNWSVIEERFSTASR